MSSLTAVARTDRDRLLEGRVGSALAYALCRCNLRVVTDRGRGGTALSLSTGTILVDPELPASTQAFSIACMLGHFRLHRGMLRRNERMGDLERKEAEEYARAFLGVDTLHLVGCLGGRA